MCQPKHGLDHLSDFLLDDAAVTSTIRSISVE
jgi:hypothetical protein